MQRSYFSRSLLAAVAFAAAACSSMAHMAVAAVCATSHFIKGLVLDGFKLASAKEASARRAVVWFVWAKAFVCRLAKRQRPVVSSSWRMCPST